MLGVMNATFLLVTLAVMMAGCVGVSNPSNRDPKLIGDWTCVSAVVDGKPLPEKTVNELRLAITQTRFITTKGAETLFDSVYRLDPSHKPRRIFMLGNEGELIGKEALGVYEISGATLRICYAMPGDPAPTTFESSPGSKAYLITWRRAAP